MVRLAMRRYEAQHARVAARATRRKRTVARAPAASIAHGARARSATERL